MGKRLLLLIPFIFILSGCTINYNLEIDGDSLTEVISGTITNEENEISSEATDIPLIYGLINYPQPAIYDDENKLYAKNIVDNESGKDYTYSYVYRGNFNKSRLIDTCFENHEIIENDDYYTIKLSGNFYCLYADSIDVNVISNNKVISSNAKKVKGNNYSWQIKRAKNVDIYMAVSKTEAFDKTKKHSNTFRIVSFIILIILSGVVFFLYKKKNSDI